jgi:cytochrome P450
MSANLTSPDSEGAELPVCRLTVPLMPGINEAWLVTPCDDVVIVLKDGRFAESRLHASFAKTLKCNMLDLDELDHTRLLRGRLSLHQPRRAHDFPDLFCF